MRLLCASLLLSFLFIFSCAEKAATMEVEEELPDPFASIDDAKAKELLMKAMEGAGGLEKWESLSEISFDKHFALFKEDGAVEMDRNQTYIQRNRKTEEGLGLDKEKDVVYQLGPDLIQISGDVNPQADAQAIENSVLSASFVISIPFKLLDEGAELSYDGTDQLEDGREVEVLKVVYKPDEYSNLSTADIWWHYFDAKTYKHLAYMVQHADHVSYVENTGLTEAGGIVFPLTRKSWRVNENREKLWLRADYEYSNYTVNGE
ncbi:MAG: hypothetical protein AAGD28_04305 [Bacteroidota bacterium]